MNTGFREHLQERLQQCIDSHSSFKEKEQELINQLKYIPKKADREGKELLILAWNSQGAAMWDMKCEYEKLIKLYDLEFSTTARTGACKLPNDFEVSAIK